MVATWVRGSGACMRVQLGARGGRKGCPIPDPTWSLVKACGVADLLRSDPASSLRSTLTRARRAGSRAYELAVSHSLCFVASPFQRSSLSHLRTHRSLSLARSFSFPL
eukprot:6179373-Pleurochrysis_carterae.AAC.1